MCSLVLKASPWSLSLKFLICQMGIIVPSRKVFWKVNEMKWVSCFANSNYSINVSSVILLVKIMMTPFPQAVDQGKHQKWGWSCRWLTLLKEELCPTTQAVDKESEVCMSQSSNQENRTFCGFNTKEI